LSTSRAYLRLYNKIPISVIRHTEAINQTEGRRNPFIFIARSTGVISIATRITARKAMVNFRKG